MALASSAEGMSLSVIGVADVVFDLEQALEEGDLALQRRNHGIALRKLRHQILLKLIDTSFFVADVGIQCTQFLRKRGFLSFHGSHGRLLQAIERGCRDPEKS